MNYTITGAPFPVVSCELSAGESMNCQKGAMVWMTENMKMQTSTEGGASCPGNILEFDISDGNTIVGQKGSYLASETGVVFETFFQKKLSAGFFGGEGFILQKFTGNGKLFIEIDGSVVQYTLQPGETMLVDTGYLAAMDATVSISIDQVKGIGNALFGGEGLFNTKLTGPGRIWLQTMPIAQFAGSIIPYIPSKG